jgi:CheY-like chemotaxis protein
MNYDLIILIDDNDNTLYVNADIVNDCFQSVTIKSFNHPTKFLAAFKDLQATYERKWLIILDLMMPELPGYKLIDYLEEHEYNLDNIDIIILTSSNLRLDIEKSEAYVNIKAFIDKPLTAEKLKSSLLF